MKNLKIQVNSEAESREVQELFFKLGGSWAAYKNIHDWPEIKQLYLDENYITFSNDINFFVKDSSKEITLPELREMVNPMKEWLNTKTFEYKQAACMFGHSEWIEIPEGAECLTKCKDRNGDEWLLFWRGDYKFCVGHDKEWFYFESGVSEYLDEWCGLAKVIWQRDQDEPFLTPECTLNDQYAEIEEVRQVEIHGTVKAKPDFNFGAAHPVDGVDATLSQRQSQYGCYEDVAHVTQQILSVLRIGNYDELPAPMKESLHMIASKMARIVNGDPEYLDNWHDIGGYAKLIEKLIKGE